MLQFLYPCPHQLCYPQPVRCRKHIPKTFIRGLTSLRWWKMLPQKSQFPLLVKLKREIWVKVWKSVSKSHNFPSRWYLRGNFGKNYRKSTSKCHNFSPQLELRGKFLKKNLDNLHLKTHNFPLLFKGEIVENFPKNHNSSESSSGV